MEIIQLVRLHRVREAEHRGEVPGAAAEGRNGLDDAAHASARTRSAPSSTTTRARPASALEREIASICRKVARHVVAEGRPGSRSSRRRRRHSSACRSTASPEGRARRGRPHQRPAVDHRRRRAARVRRRSCARQGQARDHGPAREGHGGERPGRDELRARATKPSASSRISTRRSTSTFTSRSSSARTARARA